MVIAHRFTSSSHFSEGFAVIQVEGRYGYINRSGDVVIEPIFKQAGDFKGGLAAVTEDEAIKYASCCWQRWDYIDKSGKYVWKSPAK